MPSIANQSPDVIEKISIEVKTLKRLIGLICRSTDILSDARHHEIFLDCLNTYLNESNEMDDSDCFRAVLLLNAYYEYVPPSLAELGSILDETLELIRKIK